MPTVWGLLSILEGENPGAAVSLVLCQPTDLGSELGGVGSESYSFSCASGWRPQHSELNSWVVTVRLTVCSVFGAVGLLTPSCQLCCYFLSR